MSTKHSSILYHIWAGLAVGAVLFMIWCLVQLTGCALTIGSPQRGPQELAVTHYHAVNPSTLRPGPLRMVDCKIGLLVTAIGQDPDRLLRIDIIDAERGLIRTSDYIVSDIHQWWLPEDLQSFTIRGGEKTGSLTPR